MMSEILKTKEALAAEDLKENSIGKETFKKILLKNRMQLLQMTAQHSKLLESKSIQ